MTLYSQPLKTPVWTDIPIDSSGGVTFFTPPWQRAQFFKDPLGFVHLRGLVVPPSGFTVLLGIMASGFRPLSNLIFPIMAYYDSAPDNLGFRLDIGPDGQLIVRSVSGVALSHNYASLCGVSYSTNQT